MIYLDNAATTQIHPNVLNAMLPYLKNEYGNPGSVYSLGRNAAKAIDHARHQVAEMIDATPEQIIFTSGGSESNSLVFQGLKDYLINIGKQHIIVSAIEHDSVINAAKSLIKDGFYITYLPVDKYGIIDLEVLVELLEQGDVGLVSIMYSNNEIGAVNPIYEIGKICEKYNVLFHTDCVQAMGQNVIDVNKIPCDFLSASGHKIHAPKGVGFLYARNKMLLDPLINGGTSQEFGIRGGTENVAGIVGIGSACELLCKSKSNPKDIFDMKILFFKTLLKKLYTYKLNKYLDINGDLIAESKVINLRFENVDAETLILLLDSKGIMVSAGSACRSHESEPSRVLTQIGLTPEEARDSIRISFSILNTNEEIKDAAIALADSIKLLKTGNGMLYGLDGD